MTVIDFSTRIQRRFFRPRQGTGAIQIISLLLLLLELEARLR